jgi:DNA helicase HerA-like ATPase
MNENLSIAQSTYDNNLFCGIITEVQTGIAKVLISEQSAAPQMNIGDYVVIESGDLALFGQLADLKLIFDASTERNVPSGSIKIFATINTSTATVEVGILRPATPGASVFKASELVLKLVTDAQAHGNRSDVQVALSIASVRDAYNTQISITPEMLFGRHLAVLGTTGGGKSWTLARIIEEAAQFNSKVILLDASGEFGSLSGPIAHVYIGNHPRPPMNADAVALPYYHLKETDLFSIFQPAGQAQAPKLRAAIRSLKLAQLAPAVAVEGTIVKANRSKKHYEQEYFKFLGELEKPEANFDITNLIQQIQNECVNPYRSATEPYYWGDTNPLELSYCVPLINKIQDIISSPNLSPVFKPDTRPSLLKVIDNFLEHPTLRVLCISLQYLSFSYNTREIVANAVGRYFLEMARAEKFRRSPLLVIIDEAHQFLSDLMDNKSRDILLDAYGMIAKEGRKYGLNICLATQRPRDIPESVLSQIGTFVVHRLINDKDLSVIERAASGADHSLLSSLPTLGPGEALILGADFGVPLAVRIHAPENPPQSYGPAYQECWKVG